MQPDYDDFDENFDDDPEDRSRNYDARPGYDLRDDVDLAGWDERSVWGYDTDTGSFDTQLWRNPGDNDAPDVWRRRQPATILARLRRCRRS